MQLPEPPQVLDGRYRLDDEIGSGGFAVVFRATDLKVGREVALKLLKPGRDGTYSANVRRRVEREVGLLSRLRSPHILRLLDYGETEGLLYQTFEFLEGTELAELLRERGRLPPRQAETILRQLLQGLSEAHAAGLLHRDVKPQNVMLTTRGRGELRAVLVDFGIARDIDEGASPSVTSTGEIIGTPRYMSPEQLSGRRLTPASDIYSLGVMTFEMLEGSRRLAGPALGDQIDRVMREDAFRLEAGSDATLSRIIEKMCAREPGHRFPTAQAVLRALDTPGEVATKPQEPPKPRSRWVASTVLALLAAGGLWTLMNHNDDPPPVLASNLQPSRKQVSSPDTRDGRMPDAARADAANVGDGCDGIRPHGGGFAELGTLWPGAQRHIPKSYDGTTRVPLVLLFHDEWNAPRSLIEENGFGALAEEFGFVVVAPLAPDTKGPWFGRWRNPKQAADRVTELVRDMKLLFCLDDERIFAMGHGAGGRLLPILVEQPWLRAGSTHSYRPSVEDGIAEPAARKPILVLSPQRSDLLPADGAPRCEKKSARVSLATYEDTWLKSNGCDERSRRRHNVGADATFCREWTCEVPFASCLIDGGFSLPGGKPKTDEITCKDAPPTTFDTPRLIWDFFARVSMPVRP